MTSGTCKQSCDVIFHIYVFNLSPQIAVSLFNPKWSIVPLGNDSLKCNNLFI